jgi:hypothetical protein
MPLEPVYGSIEFESEEGFRKIDQCSEMPPGAKAADYVRGVIGPRSTHRPRAAGIRRAIAGCVRT